MPVAKCKLFYYKDIPLLIMEHVHEIDRWATESELIPEDWIKYDGGQCGINRKGELVLYDMGGLESH